MTTTPQMHCSGCENRIKQNIRFVKGVKEITTSVPNQKVTIVYQKNKAIYDDFVKAFGKIGYRISRYTCTPQKK
ncbi:MAG: heavy-metal-associated domain-containing protein [Bacteroidales bacterium]|nr:heavy-metal-associated domain-containing protein [Bacteroidales bacterium]